MSEQEYGWLRRLAERDGMLVSTEMPRLVYNPGMVTGAEADAAFSDKKTKKQRAGGAVLQGELLGYPSPGDVWGKWWVTWQVRDPKDLFG